MIRMVEPKDEAIVHEWWEKRGWPKMPFSTLPPTGYIYENKAALWVYITNSPIILVEWLVTNPEAEGRGEALEELISQVCAFYEALGAKQAWTMSNVPQLKKRLLNTGYRVTDEGLSVYLKTLGE